MIRRVVIPVGSVETCDDVQLEERPALDRASRDRIRPNDFAVPIDERVVRTIVSHRIGDSETNMRSEADFERTYRGNVRAVYGYAATRVGRSEAEDVAAEVFQAAAVAFADGRADQVTPAWLMTVARNKVIDRWRRTERHTLRAHLLADAVEPTSEVDLSLEFAQRDLVLDVLSELKPRHRKLLILRHLEGRSVPEIAKLIDERPKAVESALARARGRFRSIYERRSAS